MRSIILLFTLSLFFFAQAKTYNSIETSISNFTSKSNVYVYQNNKKISELIWEAKQVPIINFNLESKKNNYFLNFLFSKNISKKDAIMNDYDWLLDSTSDWSDWSSHSDTKVDSIEIFDLYISYKNFITFLRSDIKTSLGYKKMTKIFKAYDGDYIYSENGGFRNCVGSFGQYNDCYGSIVPGGLNITYKETYKFIYMQVMVLKKIYDFQLATSVIYGPTVVIDGRDYHHLAQFIDVNKLESSMYGYGLNLSYPFSKRFYIGLDFNYERYKFTKGRRVRYNLTNNTTSSQANPALKSTNISFSNIKFKYSF